MQLTIKNGKQPCWHGTYHQPKKIHILVTVGGVVLANNRSDLDTNPGAGLTILSGTGSVEIEWSGELWIVNAPGVAGDSVLSLEDL